MGFYRGPNIVTDKLIFLIDAGNPRSFTLDASAFMYSSQDPTKFGNFVRSPLFIDEKNGAIDFNGDNYMNCSVPIRDDCVSTTLSVSAWAKFPLFVGNGYAGLFYLYQTTTSAYTLIRYNNVGGLEVLIEDGNVNKMNRDTPNLTAYQNQWINVVFTQEGDFWRFYLNGELSTLSGSGNTYCTDHLTPITLRIGNTAWGPYMDMTLSHYMIHKKGLTATEVKQNYIALKGRFE